MIPAVVRDFGAVVGARWVAEDWSPLSYEDRSEWFLSCKGQALGYGPECKSLLDSMQKGERMPADIRAALESSILAAMTADQEETVERAEYARELQSGNGEDQP